MFSEWFHVGSSERTEGRPGGAEEAELRPICLRGRRSSEWRVHVGWSLQHVLSKHWAWRWRGQFQAAGPAGQDCFY